MLFRPLIHRLLWDAISKFPLDKQEHMFYDMIILGIGLSGYSPCQLLFKMDLNRFELCVFLLIQFPEAANSADLLPSRLRCTR